MRIKRLLAITAVALAVTACSRAPSNVHVLSTTDCGANWTKLSVGESVPKHVIACGYNVAVPNWPMSGETVFKTQFSGKVISLARLSYSYTIVDPVAFLKEARFIGKMGGSLEIASGSEGTQYEMAEGIIINKLLREVTTDITRKYEVVDANPAVIEEEVFKAVQAALNKKGIAIGDVALVIENDEQTRLAIDAATAMRVYESIGKASEGLEIIKNRAAATQIRIVNNTQTPQQE